MYPDSVDMKKVIEAGGDRDLYDYIRAVIAGQVYPVTRVQYENPIGKLDNTGLYFSHFLDNLHLGLVYKGRREDGTFHFDFYSTCGQPIELRPHWAEFRLVTPDSLLYELNWKRSALHDDGLPRSGFVVYHLDDGTPIGISATFPASRSVGVYAHYSVACTDNVERTSERSCIFLFTETLSVPPKVHEVNLLNCIGTRAFYYVSEDVFVRNLVNHLNCAVKNLGEAESIPTWNFEVPKIDHKTYLQDMEVEQEHFHALNADLTRKVSEVKELASSDESAEFIAFVEKHSAAATIYDTGVGYGPTPLVFGVDANTLQANTVRSIGYKNCYYRPTMQVLTNLLDAYNEHKKTLA